MTLISYFGSLVGIPTDVTSSVVGLKNCPVTAGIKTYNLIIMNKKKK